MYHFMTIIALILGTECVKSSVPHCTGTLRLIEIKPQVFSHVGISLWVNFYELLVLRVIHRTLPAKIFLPDNLPASRGVAKSNNSQP